MTNKGLFGEIPEFYKALKSEPVDTLKTTWRGITEAPPSKEHRVLIPTLGVVGLGATFFGAATGNFLTLGVGVLDVSIAAAHYHALGRDLPPRGLEAGGPG